MKRLFLFLLITIVALNLQATEKKFIQRYNKLTKSWASYEEVTVRQIQEVPMESLLVADALQNNVPSRWTLQRSQRYEDTVVITAIVITPHAGYPNFNGISYTAHGWTMLIHDTAANSNEWGGVLVRVGSTGATPDTAQAFIDGFTIPQRGEVVKITGRVEEFPTSPLSMNTTTQFRPIPGIAIEILPIGTRPIPSPTRKQISDFNIGPNPSGTIKYSTGEAYEGSLVEFNNITVNAIVNFGRGTWQMVDGSGNYISDYDASHYFTFAHESAPEIPGDTSFHLPPVGATIDTIRGTILVASGQENPRGYRICPLYPGDAVYGITLPGVTTHRRYPVIVSSLDTVRVQARVFRLPGGEAIYRAVLLKSINNGPWQSDTMAMISPDSTYESSILDPDGNPWPANTFVKYFIKGLDILGNSKILANSSTLSSDDTSKGFFFYTVLDRPLKISDVQYTPFTNGRTPYLGGVVTVSGIVTASSSDLLLTPYSIAPTGIGTNTWYIQDGNSPWSGIWVVKRDSTTGVALDAMKLGDSVTVTGSVQEEFDITRIYDSLVTIHSSGRPVPSPVTITSGTLGPGAANGTPSAEQYEGMLVRVVDAKVSDVYPYFSDPTEYAIDDGSGPVRIRRDGVNYYSNQPGDTASNKIILFVDDKVNTLIGIVWYSYGAYKIVPRRNSDFNVGEPYQYRNGWNMISVGRNQFTTPFGYKKTTLFPTATSQAFYYQDGYFTDTNIYHRKGYWLKFSGNQVIGQLGTIRTLDTVLVVVGWNLVGTIGDSVVTNAISVYPSGNHLSSFFEYTGGYNIEDTLKPSKGYWVKSDSNGYFVLSASSAFPKKNEPVEIAREFNTITISDDQSNHQTLYFGKDSDGKIRLRDYELPPASPSEENFKVRYASGRALETYPAVLKNGIEYTINATTNSSPLTVAWNIINQDGKQFSLSYGEKGKASKAIDLKGQGNASIGTSGSAKLVLRVEAGAVPKEYSLSQNYPNPFNPSTSFLVGLPQAARLEVAAYNLLGQKVATLVDEDREAGYHTIVWNGTTQEGLSVASGVYFVRMNAQRVESSTDRFLTVRKVMMLK